MGLAVFSGRKRNVGNAGEMHLDDLEVDRLLGQPHARIEELLLVGLEREDHPHGQHAVEREGDRDVDERNPLGTEHELAKRIEGSGQPPELDLRIDRIGLALLPKALAIAFLPERLDRRDPAHALDEVGVLLRHRGDYVEVAKLDRLKESEPQSDVEPERCTGEPAEYVRIDEHQCQRQHRHQPVDEGGDHPLADQLADGLGGTEPRDDVADVALLEVIERQPHQVPEQVDDHLVGQRVRQRDQD